MVFTGMPYSSWKRRIQYNEEQERIFWEKESMNRERENEFIQECIEQDLEFAKKHYQTTGSITYSIPVNDLPKDFNNLEVSLEVNLCLSFVLLYIFDTDASQKVLNFTFEFSEKSMELLSQFVEKSTDSFYKLLLFPFMN